MTKTEKKAAARQQLHKTQDKEERERLTEKRKENSQRMRKIQIQKRKHMRNEILDWT